MTKEQFFDWISGYYDICKPDRIGVVETQTIKDHIDLVRGIEKLPPRMAEEDVEKFFAGLPSPPKVSDGSISEVKKSSSGRVRPTIDAPPPPPIQEGKIVYEFGDSAGTRIESKLNGNFSPSKQNVPLSTRLLC